MCFEVGHGIVEGHRPAEQVALQHVATQCGQKVPLGLGFHPLGNQFETQAVAQRNGCGTDGGVVRIGLDVGDE